MSVGVNAPRQSSPPLGLVAFGVLLAVMVGTGIYVLQQDVPSSSGRVAPVRSTPPPVIPETTDEPLSRDATAPVRSAEEVPESFQERVVSPAPRQVSAAEREQRLRHVRAMAQSSPADALRWALSLTEDRDPVVIAASYEAGRADPEKALRALTELPDSLERNGAMNHVVAQWAVKDATASTQWAAKMPEGKVREDLCTAVAIGLAMQNPAAAADFVATQITEGATLRVAAVSVAQRWAQVDPAAARAWAEQFPAGILRDETLREIAAQSRKRTPQ